MDASDSRPIDETRRTGRRLLRQTFERSTGPAFWLVGASMLASVVVPVGLSAVTNRAWTSGLILVGLAVLAAFVGVFGMVLRLDEVSWALRAGTAASAMAAVVAVGWLVALGMVLSGPEPTAWPIPDPMGLFRWSAVAMAGGFALGYLAVGTAHWRGTGPHRRTGRLLAIGGLALLVPVTVVLLRPVTGVRPPGWLLFSILGFVALDTLLIGSVHRSSRSKPSRR